MLVVAVTEVLVVNAEFPSAQVVIITLDGLVKNVEDVVSLQLLEEPSDATFIRIISDKPFPKLDVPPTMYR